MHVIVITPAGTMKLFAHLFHRYQPSPTRGRVGTCIAIFEACSTFNHVTTCMLAESLIRSFPEGSSDLVT
jgi:hypothetical protein